MKDILCPNCKGNSTSRYSVVAGKYNIVNYVECHDCKDGWLILTPSRYNIEGREAVVFGRKPVKVAVDTPESPKVKEKV